MLALATATAAAAQPEPRAVPSFPGAQIARFQVIVEGSIEATTSETVGGTNPLCDAYLQGTYTERSTYRRGRGVVMEFVRLGSFRRAPVILRRAGRAADSTLAVRVRVVRYAAGVARRSPVPPGTPETCPPVDEDLSTGPECGTPRRTGGKLALEYAGRSLGLRPVGLGSLLEIDCTRSEVTQILPEVRFGWPTPVRLPKATLAPAVIFGKRRVIVLRMTSPRRSQTHIAQLPAGLVGRYVDVGENEAIVRLIRVG